LNVTTFVVHLPHLVYADTMNMQMCPTSTHSYRPTTCDLHPGPANHQTEH